MNDEVLSAVLEDAGLSPYQAEAYVTLLSLGTASATDVAEASDVPDPRIYDVLRDLEAEGYVETFQQERLTARARDPETVVRDLHSRSERLLDAAAAIENRWTSPALADHELTVVSRFETVFERARELVADADVLIAASLSVDVFRELRTDLAAAHDRGVMVFLVVWTDDGDETPDPDAFVDACTEVRHRQAATPFLTVVDRTNTCFSSRCQDPSEYGLLVDDEGHAGVFWWFFTFCLWRGSDVLHSERDDGPPERFLDVYECAESIRSRQAEGVTLTVEVVGSRTDTDEPVTLSGTVVDSGTGIPIADTNPEVPSNDGAGSRGLTVKSADGEMFTVGGWGPIVEDVRATCVTITDVVEE